MRRTLTTSDPTVLGCHDHVAWCGDGPAAFEALAVAAFRAATRRRERLLFVADDPDPARLAGLPGWEHLVDRGALLTARTADTYTVPIDTVAQAAEFEGVVKQALADGYNGMCVVADNSALAGGTAAEFASWLAWEAAADRLQDSRPINGICYFDRTQVPDDRLADLAVLHPVRSTDVAEPAFQLFADGGVLRATGEIDSFCVERLRRLLRHAPQLAERPIDLAGVEFIDHRALLVLHQAAQAGNAADTWQVHGARPIVRRLWDLLDVPDPGLELC